MFFGIQRPPDITWAVSASGTGGTGASIISSASNLTDGRPDSTARFQWPTGASQNTSTIMHIKGDWTATSFSPRLVGLSNISLPVGTKVQVAFRRSTDTLGTYPYNPTITNNGQRIFQGPRGERTLWIMLPSGATAVLGVDIQIFNDVSGSASITAGTLFNVGEAVVCPAVEMDIEPGWDQFYVDPTTDSFSWNRQPYTQPGCPYRQGDYALALDQQKIYFGDSANPTNTDVEELLSYLDRGQSAVYIARYTDSSGAFDATELHRMAFIGIAKQLPKISQKTGSYYASGAMQVVEAPVPT